MAAYKAPKIRTNKTTYGINYDPFGTTVTRKGTKGFVSLQKGGGGFGEDTPEYGIKFYKKF